MRWAVTLLGPILQKKKKFNLKKKNSIRIIPKFQNISICQAK